MEDIKPFAKREKELETLIHANRIYSRDVGMGFSIEKYAMLVMKSGKWHITDGIELPNQEKLEGSEKRKCENYWEYWKLTPSNKWRWKKKFGKSISGELGSNSRQKYTAETVSKR